MKKLMYLCAVAIVAIACNPSNNGDLTTDKEETLQKAVLPYVKNTVLPTYKGMADNSVLLNEACANILKKYDSQTLTSADVEKACKAWNDCRQYWEESETFLYGPAANHNIDPHIDSWPLDQNAMVSMLNNPAVMAQIEEQGGEYVGNNLGYGLLGFHAIEYNLFELSADGQTSKVHSIDTYTRAQLVYLQAVAEDLMQQCVLLYACWAGEENDYGENYGDYMINADKAGSVYKTYQEAAEEIINGAIDIIDEVAAMKMGRPHAGSSEEDRNYIESPYSLNSINDFVGNIISVRNAYQHISDFIALNNKDLDTRVRQAIEETITAIHQVPEPFALHATGTETANAIEKLQTLSDLMSNEVLAELSK